VSDRDARPERGGPNTLRDQAIPNVLPDPEVHVAPARLNDALDDGAAAAIHDRWQPTTTTPEHGTATNEVAGRLHALAVHFAVRSEGVEARLLEGFRAEAAPLAGQIGDVVVRNSDDERISMLSNGSFSGQVLTEDAPTSWLPLETSVDIVNFCDPSELFADLADRLAAAHHSVRNPGVEDAGPRLRQLVEAYLARSASDGSGIEAAEVGLIEQFEEAAARFTQQLGSIIVLDDADERLTLDRDGLFVAEVVPEDDESSWRSLRTSEQLTDYYTPAELFQALAEKLAAAFRSASDAGAEVAAGALHDLALEWREQSLDAEARLFEEFNRASAGSARVGEFVIIDDDDEQLVIGSDGQLSARFLDRSTGVWRELNGPDEMVDSYDPTDVFADLADALREAYPGLVPR
jgi:hypothetical protein